MPLFKGASDVLDVGCGRGEFLDLLRENGISARGIDLNDEMAAVSRERGLDATAGDALSYLLAQPDGSLGGLFAAQVAEHLEPDYLMRFLDAAYHKLRPGSKIVLETINPACWFAFFSSYIRDITHERPLHPDTLQYLLRASGFQNVTVRYSAPYPDESKLQRVRGVVAERRGRVQRQRDEAELAALHLSRLRRHWRTNVTHVINVFHGIGASLACAACFYLAGHVLVPRAWDSSLRHAGFPVLGAALYVMLCWIAISAQRIPLNLVATVFVAGVLALSSSHCAAVIGCRAGGYRERPGATEVPYDRHDCIVRALLRAGLCDDVAAGR